MNIDARIRKFLEITLFSPFEVIDIFRQNISRKSDFEDY